MLKKKNTLMVLFKMGTCGQSAKKEVLEKTNKQTNKFR